MENRLWIYLALTSAYASLILGSDFGDTYDPLRYSSPQLNPQNLYPDEIPHSRRKRAAEDIADVPPGEPVPDNMTMYMYKTGEYENVTEMRVGSRMCFLLAAHFPADTTNFLVELFTPDNETTIMAIYDVQIIHYGTNLAIDNNPVNIVYESKDEDVAAGLWRPDRVVLDFGNVSNVGPATDYKDNMIQITWCIVMINDNGTENGTTLWASAGADYYYEEEIWIGQASLVAITDEPTISTPTFNFSGPDTVEIGSSASFTIDMVNTYPSVQLSLDAFAPLNDTGYMSVCTMAVSYVGPTFGCKPCFEKEKKNKENSKLTYFPSVTGFGNFRGRLDLDIVTATGFYDAEFPTDQDRTIRYEFQISVKDDEQYIGKQEWIGAAIEIGDTQIWAGQILIEVVNRTEKNLTLSSDPTISMSTETDPYQVGMFHTVKYYLDVEIPENSLSDYVLEVLAPLNDTAQMRICRVQILEDYFGVNAPCVTSEPEYLSRVDNETTDRVVWGLGRLLNNGARMKADDPTANRLRFEIAAQVLNHTLLTDGDKLWLTAGLLYSMEESLWVGMNAIVYNESTDTSLETPDMSMVYTFGNESIPVGGVGCINLTMTTKRGTVYMPMDMEIILPYENDTAVMTMCRAEITHIGKNMPCSEQIKINSSILYTHKGNDTTKPVKAVFSLGPVCNTGDETKTQPTEDDQLTITFCFKLEEHILNTPGAEQWPSAGLMFHDTRMWVGMLKTIVSDIEESYTEEQPHVELNRTTDPTNTDIGIGQNVLYDLIIQTPHKSRANWKVTVESGTDKLSVCAMRMVEVGWYLPCLDAPSLKFNTTDFWPGDYGKTNKQNELDIGYVTNVGELPKTNDSIFGNHSMRLQVMVFASRKAVSGDSLSFTITADASGTTQYQETVTLNAVDAIVQTTEDTFAPEFSFYVMPIGGDSNENVSKNVNQSVDIAKGEAVQFRLDIKVPTWSSNKLIVKYLSPVNSSGIMEVTDITTTHVGVNLPCHDRGSFLEYEEGVVTRTDAIHPDLADIRSMDLGYICNFPIETNDSIADTITVEGILKVLKEAPVNDGDTQWASVTARINDDQIYVAQILVNIRDDFNETVYSKSIEELVSNYTDGNDPWKFKTNERITIPFVVTVAPNQTIKAMIDVKMPVNLTAVGVIEELKLIEAGRNLAMFDNSINRNDPNNTRFPATFGSILNNTQNDSAFLDIGVITNTGVTYRRGDFKEEDNQFRFEAKIWVADAAVFEDNSTHWLSAGAKVGSVIIILDSQFEADRDGAERPDLCIAASVNTTETFDTNSPAEFTFTIQHTNQSSAEAYNVSVAFYFTGFLNFSGVDYCNVSETLQIEPVVDFQNTALRKAKFTFNQVLFTDNVYCVIKLNSNDGFAEIPSAESGAAQNASTPFEGSYQSIYRMGGAYADGKWFYSSMDYIDPDVAVPGGVSCQEIRIIQDTAFQDCQITGSYSEPDHSPEKARWDSGGSWKPMVRQSTAYPKYIDVALGNLTKVTKVHVSYSGSNDRVGMAKALYSMDGVNYLNGEDMDFDPAYTDGYIYSMVSPQEARYIRIVLTDAETPNKADPKYEVRFEFEGCVLSSDVSSADVCSSNDWEYEIPAQLQPDYYPRGFITDFNAGNQAYICDLNPNLGKDFKWTDWNALVNENAQMRCYESPDGNTYNSVDERVINVIGYYKPNPVPDEVLADELFAIDQTKRALLVSEDGVNFRSCDLARLQKRKSSTEGTYTQATKLDWISDNDFGPSVPAAGTYVRGSWGATYEGMEFGSTKKLDWSVCCL